MAFIVLEWLILILKGKPLPLLGDTFASAAMIGKIKLSTQNNKARIEIMSYIFYLNYLVIMECARFVVFLYLSLHFKWLFMVFVLF